MTEQNENEAAGGGSALTAVLGAEQKRKDDGTEQSSKRCT